MLTLLTVAIAPSLALFSYFYLRREIAEEPSITLFQTFVYGAVMTFPILFIQHVFEEEQLFHSIYLQQVGFTSLLEEFFKWFILLIAIYNHYDFDDAYDGILYGASISLGFATVENILYLFTFGLDTAMIRAFLPVSSHALFGVVMGYYFGKAKFSEQKQNSYLLLAFIAPLTLHIAYNSILTLDRLWVYFIIPFMLFLWWFGLTKVKHAHLLVKLKYEKS
ncbi:glutamic-type intramembrane protease PrsW [Savagea faecisuis]|uniref:Protease PrsW n=1 Tax=Savagea faecisuis TaxID=1274803 RepID=A0ABW3H282_9BACL